RINCVAPGMVETEMVDRSPQTPEQIEAVKRTHPLGLGAPRDVAHAIVFLRAVVGSPKFRRMTSAGLPIASEYGGMLLITTLFAPTMAPSPMVTPFII